MLLAIFKVFAIMGAIFGFLGAEPCAPDAEASRGLLPLERVGSDTAGLACLADAFDGMLLKAVPFFS